MAEKKQKQRPNSYKICHISPVSGLDDLHKSHNVDTRNDLISPLTTEFRFSCLHAEMSDSWTLQIRYTQVVTFLLSPWSSFMLFAQLRDIGEYQCHNYYQISIIIIFTVIIMMMITTVQSRISGSTSVTIIIN